jgi:predicted ATPase
MQNKIILLIGGPSSGKTTLIEALAKIGHICYPEISREITLKARENGAEQLFLTQPLLFSEMLLEGRINQFKSAENEENLVFIDRGIPDIIAYMDFIGDTYPTHFTESCLKFKYDKVFILPPWEEIYQSDNERYETYEEAVKIHEHLVKTYVNFGYNLIEVPKDNIENRLDFILNNLK